jgi:hypothetical protein
MVTVTEIIAAHRSGAVTPVIVTASSARKGHLRTT